MTKYKKISALFKEHNLDLYNWIIEQAKIEDVSASAFIIRSLKKLRGGQNAENKVEHTEVSK